MNQANSHLTTAHLFEQVGLAIYLSALFDGFLSEKLVGFFEATKDAILRDFYRR